MLKTIVDRVKEVVVGPTFDSRLDLVCRQTGWTPVMRTSQAATFRFRSEFRCITAMAMPSRDTIRLIANGRTDFPAKRFPAVLWEVLQMRNRQLDEYQWLIWESQELCWPALATTVPLKCWDGPLMRFAVDRMYGELDTLDTGLQKMGWIP